MEIIFTLSLHHYTLLTQLILSNIQHVILRNRDEGTVSEVPTLHTAEKFKFIKIQYSIFFKTRGSQNVQFIYFQGVDLMWYTTLMSDRISYKYIMAEGGDDTSLCYRAKKPFLCTDMCVYT